MAQHFKAVAAGIWVAKIIAVAAVSLVEVTWVAVDLVRAAVVSSVEVTGAAVVLVKAAAGLVAKADLVMGTMVCN